MGGEWSEILLGDVVEIKHGFAFSGEHFRDEPPGPRKADFEKIWISAGQTGESDADSIGAGGSVIGGVGGGMNPWVTDDLLLASGLVILFKPILTEEKADHPPAISLTCMKHLTFTYTGSRSISSSTAVPRTKPI